MMLTMPLGFVFLLMTAMMRGVGDTLTPLLALALSTAIGLILTPLLIRGWFGLPALGVTSPAVGVGDCQRADAVRARFLSAPQEEPAGAGRRISARLRLDGALLARSCGIGIPSAVGMVVMAIAELVLLGLVNGFGSDATAAYGAVNQIMGYAQFTGDIDFDLGLDPRRAGDRRRPCRPAGRHRPDRPAAQSRPDRRPGGADLSVSARRAGHLHYRQQPCSSSRKELLIIALWSSVPFGMATVFSGAMRAGGVALAPHAAVDLRHRRDRDTLCRDPEPHHRARRASGPPIRSCSAPCSSCNSAITRWSGAAGRFSGWFDVGSRALPRYYDRHNTVDAPPALRHNAAKHRGRLP